jgi:hypothetical protein
VGGERLEGNFQSRFVGAPEMGIDNRWLVLREGVFSVFIGGFKRRLSVPVADSELVEVFVEGELIVDGAWSLRAGCRG